MRELVKVIQDWYLQNPQGPLERWEQTRAKGKAAYVRKQMIVFPVLMTVLTDFSVYFVDRRTVPVVGLRSIIIYSIIGFFGGLIGWTTQERKYLRSIRRQ